MVILIVKVGFVLKAILEYIQTDPKQRVVEENPWPQIIVSILQQGGMGFEEIGFEGVEYDEDEFENGPLITQKGINAKARSWGSVRQNVKRIAAGGSTRRKSQMNKLFGNQSEEGNKLNTEDSEDIAIANKRQFYNSAVESPLAPINREPRSPATTMPKTYNNPVYNNDYEETDDAELEFKGYQRKKEVNRVADFAAEKEAYVRDHSRGGNSERSTSTRNQEDVFIDPDIMVGMKMSHLKKMDLRSVDK